MTVFTDSIVRIFMKYIYREERRAASFLFPASGSKSFPATRPFFSSSAINSPLFIRETGFPSGAEGAGSAGGVSEDAGPLEAPSSGTLSPSGSFHAAGARFSGLFEPSEEFSGALSDNSEEPSDFFL